ncbi:MULTISPECIES: dimethylsulfonioproprionate lyase family protein [Falsihalocynthiibacter]|uniref:dimethylsulfonioproprionate lyase family protein n=1 Tax=Falsihalocynthiibacter TaxID=2854182 RepID=UPI00300120ED
MTLDQDPTPPQTQLRLNDAVDMRYLLREYYDLYRKIASGGSTKIRSHQRAVREAIGRVIKANPPVVLRTPDRLPVTDHLRRSIDLGRKDQMVSMVRALDAVRDDLSWEYGYEKIPKGLAQKYGYAEIAGPKGPIRTTEVILGVVLFAPGCTYPAHAHNGITESYVCLSGAVSENHQGVYTPGSMIFNPPEQLHRITVSDIDPALLAYAWIAPPEILTSNTMNFRRSK